MTKSFNIGISIGIIALICLGVFALFTYTSHPSHITTTTTNASTTSSIIIGPAGGYQSNGQPEGAWADYLGYIPSGYIVAPHFVIANTYSCPSGMNTQQCNTFKASCGNGVCDPNESCASCPIDCGINGQLTCDPYTGRAGAPISVCQVGQIG